MLTFNKCINKIINYLLYLIFVPHQFTIETQQNFDPKKRSILFSKGAKTRELITNTQQPIIYGIISKSCTPFTEYNATILCIW